MSAAENNRGPGRESSEVGPVRPGPQGQEDKS